MIHSMTGFGAASCESQGVHYVVEIRSLNNRYFKAVIRLPDELAGLEPDLDSALRKRLTRGTITCNVAVRFPEANLGYQINHAMLGGYLKSLSDLRQANKDLESLVNVDLGSLLLLPGVVQPPASSDLMDQARPVVAKLLGEACDKLIDMRRREGEGLATDLQRHQQFIAERLKEIDGRAPVVVEEYHDRLKHRVTELMARAEIKLAEVDLSKEVAIYAERSDIAEEIQRIAAHLDQLEQIVAHDGDKPAGRTLDFLTQELLREANTIASKSNDAQISRLIVEVKGAIDRIKEQVQNVE